MTTRSCPPEIDRGIEPVNVHAQYSALCYRCGEHAGIHYVALMYWRDAGDEVADSDVLCPDCAAALATELKRAATQAKKRRDAGPPFDQLEPEPSTIPVWRPEPTEYVWQDDDGAAVDSETAAIVRFYNVPRTIIGRRFKMARQMRGYSRLRLAQTTGVDWWSIVDVENDALATPLPDYLMHRLMTVLGFRRAFYEYESDGLPGLMPWSSNSERLHHEWSEQDIELL